jgi:hypothetical protein
MMVRNVSAGFAPPIGPYPTITNVGAGLDSYDFAFWMMEVPLRWLALFQACEHCDSDRQNRLLGFQYLLY